MSLTRHKRVQMDVVGPSQDGTNGCCWPVTRGYKWMSLTRHKTVQMDVVDPSQEGTNGCR